VADDRAQVVIIGGGVAGTSIAYHLTRLGWTDVLLVDRGELTSGSTFHSAGLVAQLRNSVSHTRMMMYGAELYPTLASQTGVDPGWHQVGTLHLASSPYRMEALARQAGWAKSFGLPVEIVSTEEALERFPLIDASRVLGAQFVPTDGHIDPTGLTLSFAAGAKAAGARVRTGVRVEEVTVRDGRVRGIVTDQGPIEAEVVVNAGGIWANELGRLAGVEIPVVPMEHQYLITRPIEGVRADFPTLRDPDNLVYVREEVGGLVVGGYERDPDPWHVHDPIPPDFNHRLLPEKWERFEAIADGAFRLIPALQTTEINRFINGPEAFTPDDDFILGETEVEGFFVAAGFCAHGVTGAAGIGRWTAEWIVGGEPSMDLSKMDIRRFGRQYRSREYSLAKAYEIYAKHYDVRYPGEENEAGRPLRMAPTYARLEALNAEFGEKAGWERVPFERGSLARRAPAARLGGRTVVHRDRRRAPRRAGAGGPLRRDELREVRDLGSRSPRPVAAAVCQRRRPARRSGRVHTDAQPPRRHRVGPHGHTARSRPVPCHDRHGIGQQGSRVDPEARRRGLGRRHPRCDLGARVPGDLGAGGASDPRRGVR
jgi:glycine/D-amino acid oxidase-like deaminating enzyme